MAKGASKITAPPCPVLPPPAASDARSHTSVSRSSALLAGGDKRVQLDAVILKGALNPAGAGLCVHLVDPANPAPDSPRNDAPAVPVGAKRDDGLKVNVEGALHR